jgi:hypothetical protein
MILAAFVLSCPDMESPSHAELYDAIVKQWMGISLPGFMHVLGASLKAIPESPTRDSNGCVIESDVWYEVSDQGIYPLPF